MKKLILLGMALILCLAAPGLNGIAEGTDPVIVRVGKMEYPLSLARYAYQSNLDLLSYQGYSPTAEEKRQLIDQAVEHLVEIGLIENKLAEAGQNVLTEAEEARLRSYAGNVYESLWQNFQARVEQEGYEASEKEITEWLAEQGYTLDLVYQEALISLRSERILALYCGDVAITPEETEAWYRETFLTPDREAYEKDIPRFEQQILETGNESFYTPEGYRVIRQILLPYPKEIIDQVNALQPALEEKAASLEAAYNAVAEAGIAGGDVAAARAAYEAESKAYGELLDRVLELENGALPLLKETTDRIAERYAAGEPFEDLIAEYGQEAGEEAGQELLFHPDSTRWAETFRQRVAALEKPGELTEPFVTEQGIHIVWYERDYPGGEHPLTEEERKLLEASALQAKQTEKLRKLMAEWRPRYEIETHPELLNP